MCFYNADKASGYNNVNKTEKLPNPMAVYPSVFAPKLTANKPIKMEREPRVTG